MRPIPVSQYLNRLADTQAIGAVAALTIQPGTHALDFGGDDRAEEERDAAYLRGIREGEERAAVIHEARLSEERAAAEERLNEAQARWAAEEGRRLAAAMREGLEAHAENLADHAGRLLAPFVEAQVLARATAELRDAVGQFVRGQGTAGDRAIVRITGPGQLLAAIRDALDVAAAPTMEFVEADAIDVRITAGDTLIESHLATWFERLREAVA